MKKLIDNFDSRPGAHCGSTAMRNLLHHFYRLDLPEEVVFGLGAGLDFYLLPMELPMLSGRSVSLEEDAAAHLGVNYSELFEPDNAKAWEAARNEVLDGRPVMLTGDIYYLDYREFKVHFPAHRFVLTGFDEDAGEAYIMDRIHSNAEICSLTALEKSRNPPRGISTFNLYGRFSPPFEEITTSGIRLACARALRTNAGRMTGNDENRSMLMQGLKMRYDLKTGIEALKALPETILNWRDGENAAATASFNADCIEKFGTGGGLFRNLYAGFLEYASENFPDLVKREEVALCRRSAEAWTTMGGNFGKIGEHPENQSLWAACIDLAREIGDVEEALFHSLDERLSTD